MEERTAEVWMVHELSIKKQKDSLILLMADHYLFALLFSQLQFQINM